MDGRTEVPTTDSQTDGHTDIQGPVVQSVVSLTSSLRVISLTVLADSIHNILIFFAEKMWVAFALQKLLTFFQQKISAYLRITAADVNFNESLTNDIVSFEQLGPDGNHYNTNIVMKYSFKSPRFSLGSKETGFIYQNLLKFICPLAFNTAVGARYDL